MPQAEMDLAIVPEAGEAAALRAVHVRVLVHTGGTC
jgi:hypothetical protein